jgi:hypothetical protein
MGIIYETIQVPSLHNYDPEYNDDGTEKHIILDGARFHVISWCSKGEQCSVENCEINKESPTR